ncbi:MAG: hypothetical protein EXR60_06470 [Dehalococcoidia bacterium]|nr:hypothetical protein [Dehalococcoidia bacterium]
MAPETTPPEMLTPEAPPQSTLLELVRGLSPVLALAGVAALIVAGVFQLVFTDLSLYTIIVLGIGAVLLLAAIALSFEAVKDALVGRRGRYGLNTLIMVSAFLGLAVVANFLASQYNARFDVTTGRQFTLARGTLATLQDLKVDVQVTGFFSPETGGVDAILKGQAEDLLSAYGRVTPRIKYRAIDYQVQPQALANYNLTSEPPVLIFETPERAQPVFGRLTEAGVPQFTEQDLTSALLVATGVKLKKVYFTAGHEERDIGDSGDLSTGYGLIRQGVEGDNYQVENLILATLKEVPTDANVLVVAGPKTNFLPGEVQAIDAYLRRGGKALFLADQNTSEEFLGLLQTWGIAVKKGVIADPSRHVNPNITDVVPITSAHPVIGNLSIIFLPAAVALEPASDKLAPALAACQQGSAADVDGSLFQFCPLLFSTPNSWLEKDAAQSPPKFDKGTDTAGPLIMGMAAIIFGPPEGKGKGAATNPEKPAQFVVLGDTDFADNANRGRNNPQLFLNAVNWLAEQENLIDLPQKPSGSRRLILSPEAANWIQWSSPLLLPALVLALGGLNWWRRR